MCTKAQVALVVKNPPDNAGDARVAGLIPRSGRSLEYEMETHSSVLAWKIPRAEEPGRLQRGVTELDMTEQLDTLGMQLLGLEETPNSPKFYTILHSHQELMRVLACSIS